MARWVAQCARLSQSNRLSSSSVLSPHRQTARLRSARWESVRAMGISPWDPSSIAQWMGVSTMLRDVTWWRGGGGWCRMGTSPREHSHETLPPCRRLLLWICHGRGVLPQQHGNPHHQRSSGREARCILRGRCARSMRDPSGRVEWTVCRTLGQWLPL